MDYQIMEKPAFFVIEKVETHNTENGENLKSVPEFWTRANADGTTERIMTLASDKTFVFGICYDDPDRKGNTFEYSIGAKCEEHTAVPAGYRKTRIPARTWAVFPCKGAMPDAIQNAWREIYREFFPNSEYRSMRDIEIEAYPDGDTESPTYYSEIWIPVEKR